MTGEEEKGRKKRGGRSWKINVNKENSADNKGIKVRIDDHDGRQLRGDYGDGVELSGRLTLMSEVYAC